MTAVKQRNPYLKRLSANTPHKYSYDIQTGKYVLHTSTGNDMQISKIGTLKPKFRHNLSGFANAKQRYQQSINQPALMPFIPQFKYNHSRSFYTPKPQKFGGYSQFPYKLNPSYPQHLCTPVPSQPHKIPSSTHSSLIMMRKCQSQNKSSKPKPSSSIILENSSACFLNQEEKDQYFSMSFTNITQSKPLPRKMRKQCYNYKCKHAKYFVFDEKSKVQQSTMCSRNSWTDKMDRTLNKSFYQTTLKLQGQQTKLIQFG